MLLWGWHAGPQLRDRGVLHDSAHLGRVLARMLQLPRRYRLAWRETRGSAPVFIWALEPPSDAFVPLGMVATPSAEPPAPDAARCVPRTWCEPATEEGMQRVWQDGRAGGLWRVRQTGLLVASRTTAAPEGTCFQLRRDLAAGEARLVDLLCDEFRINVT